MSSPSIQTNKRCYGCWHPLYTTQADIDDRIRLVEQLEPGDGRKCPSNTVRTYCINRKCAKPHKAIFVAASSVPGLVLPT